MVTVFVVVAIGGCAGNEKQTEEENDLHWEWIVLDLGCVACSSVRDSV